MGYHWGPRHVSFRESLGDVRTRQNGLKIPIGTPGLGREYLKKFASSFLIPRSNRKDMRRVMPATGSRTFRLSIYPEGNRSAMKAIEISEETSLSDLVSATAKALGSQKTHLYLESGALIEDITLISDGDILMVTNPYKFYPVDLGVHKCSGCAILSVHTYYFKEY
eukprot:333350-Amorphochlora_amoeboformis.AAC.1